MSADILAMSAGNGEVTTEGSPKGNSLQSQSSSLSAGPVPTVSRRCRVVRGRVLHLAWGRGVGGRSCRVEFLPRSRTTPSATPCSRGAKRRHDDARTIWPFARPSQSGILISGRFGLFRDGFRHPVAQFSTPPATPVPRRIFAIIRDRVRRLRAPGRGPAAGPGGPRRHPGGARAGAENPKQLKHLRPHHRRLTGPRAARHVRDMELTHSMCLARCFRVALPSGAGVGLVDFRAGAAKTPQSSSKCHSRAIPATFATSSMAPAEPGARSAPA